MEILICYRKYGIMHRTSIRWRIHQTAETVLSFCFPGVNWTETSVFKFQLFCCCGIIKTLPKDFFCWPWERWVWAIIDSLYVFFFGLTFWLCCERAVERTVKHSWRFSAHTLIISFHNNCVWRSIILGLIITHCKIDFSHVNLRSVFVICFQIEYN